MSLMFIYSNLFFLVKAFIKQKSFPASPVSLLYLQFEDQLHYVTF